MNELHEYNFQKFLIFIRDIRLFVQFVFHVFVLKICVICENLRPINSPTY